MVSSISNLKIYFQKLFPETFSKSSSNKLLEQIEIITPPPGEPFWSSTDSPLGIYLILEGKVRLLDSQDNLVASLLPGIIIGQTSLFP